MGTIHGVGGCRIHEGVATMTNLPVPLKRIDLDWLRSLVWVTREGVKLKISEMSDTHLENAIAWIDRNEHRMDEVESHYQSLAIMHANNGVSVHRGTARVFEQYAIHVKDKVAWIKLCREGMKIEQSHRAGIKRIGFGDPL